MLKSTKINSELLQSLSSRRAESHRTIKLILSSRAIKFMHCNSPLIPSYASAKYKNCNSFYSETITLILQKVRNKKVNIWKQLKLYNLIIENELIPKMKLFILFQLSWEQFFFGYFNWKRELFLSISIQVSTLFEIHVRIDGVDVNLVGKLEYFLNWIWQENNRKWRKN